MELLEGHALRRRILESYSKNPRGWSFVVSPSPASGFYYAVASGPEGAWMLMIDSIFKPLPIVLGSQTEAGAVESESPFTYGFRKLPPVMMLRLLGGKERPPQEQIHAGILSLLGSEPVVPESGGSYAQGPFVLTGPRKLPLSERQQAVDAKLSQEMRRLLRARYPAYG